jgi:hypothetical protein
VVEKANAEKRSCLLELAGDVLVGLGRRQVATGMIVDCDERCSIREDESLHDLAGMDLARAE